MLLVKVRINPPMTGAIVRPRPVAELSKPMRSPRLVGNRSAIVASVTGTKIAVAKP